MWNIVNVQVNHFPTYPLPVMGLFLFKWKDNNNITHDTRLKCSNITIFMQQKQCWRDSNNTLTILPLSKCLYIYYWYSNILYIFQFFRQYFLFGLLMRRRLSLWDTESMLTKQTGWCYMMSSCEHIECSTGLIYIGLALRQKGLFIKTSTTALLGLGAR